MAQKLPTILREEEVEILLEQPNTRTPTGLRNRAMLECMANAGLRVSEVVKLKVSHIRWKTGELEIHDGKGGEERVVPLHPQTMDWLFRWNEKRPKGSRYFFCSVKSRGNGAKIGNQLTTRYCDQLVKWCAEKGGIQVTEQGPKRLRYRIHAHALRHYYATMKLRGHRFDLAEVRDLLGHKNLATTSRYLHSDPEELREKVQAEPTNEERASRAEKVRAARELLAEFAEEMGETTE